MIQESKDKPEVPTMVNPIPLEPMVRRPVGAPPEELAADIVAAPLTGPDFANDIQSYLVNQSLSCRWIFTDRRRYAEAKSQGWRNATAQDLKPGFATLNPFSEEGGTKFINGDLILMVIEKRRYLGALRKKHDAAFQLATPALQKEMSRRMADNELRGAGATGKMSAFTPDQTPVAIPAEAASKINRLGHDGPPDMGWRDGAVGDFDFDKGGK